MTLSVPSAIPPLLRAPPFSGLARSRPLAAPEAEPLSPAESEDLISALVEARVGGEFWGEDNAASNRDAEVQPKVVFRNVNPEDAVNTLAERGDGRTRNLASESIGGAIDPWSVLPKTRLLIAHGDDDWVALASLMNLDVQIINPGPFGQPGDTSETLKQRALTALTQPFPDPFGEGWLSPSETIAVLRDWRRVIDGNRGRAGERIVAACGMSWWKRNEIRRFLWSPGARLSIHWSAAGALEAAARRNGALAVWPSRISINLEERARQKGVKLVRVEDGFVRSVGLGSNLVPPLSVIVDRQGIHYDPSKPSDLESILSQTHFSPALLDRAARLRASIVASKISKYAAGEPGQSSPSMPPEKARRIVLVPGQVEDDLSVLAGGQGLSSNLELLRRTRALEPEAEIWWRPHPDVDAGHRKGAVDDASALEHADRIVREGAMSDLLDQVDALHTLTSLSGFEALMRGCEVVCHGVPFYSGWGLTRDLGKIPARRQRKLSLDELVAGVLLLYPRYLDPVTGLPCPPETLVQRLARGEANNRLSWIEPLRKVQGGITRRLRELSGQ